MEENEKQVLIDVRTKLPLETYMKVAEETAVKNCKRGKLFENALNLYFDMETYCLDRVERENLLGSKNHSDICRLREIERRIERFEAKVEDIYGIRFWKAETIMEEF